MKTPKNQAKRQTIATRDLPQIGLFVALLAVFSWITIPTVVPFTLQTFGVFLALLILGGKRGTLAILAYLLLGAIGLPVFSGFTGGVGRLFGPTGGYLLGFVACGLVYCLFERLPLRRPVRQILALSLGLILAYILGTAWFVAVGSSGTTPMSFGAAISLCVLPFLLPDALKLLLAYVLSNRIRRTGVLREHLP